MAGVAVERLFRTTLSRPIPAAVFLILNTAAFCAGEALRRRAAPVTVPRTAAPSLADDEPAQTGEAIDTKPAQFPRPRMLIGCVQILALLSGISSLRHHHRGRAVARLIP